MHARSHKNVNLRCRYSAARGEDALWHQSAWIAFEGRKWKWARKREWQLCHSLHTWYSFWIWCTNNREILSDRFVCLERAYRILNRRWTMRFLLWPAMIVLVVSFGSSCWVSRRPSSGKTVSHHMRQMLSLHDVSRTFAIDPLRRKREKEEPHTTPNLETNLQFALWAQLEHYSPHKFCNLGLQI